MALSYATILLLLFYSLCASASVLPAGPNKALNARAVPADCKKPIIKVVTAVLSDFPSFASKICSTVLHRTPPATVTVTSTNTATGYATLSGSVTSTVSLGIYTSTTQTTTTTTATATTVITTTTNPTVTVTTTGATITSAVTVTTTPATVTVTATTYTYIPAVAKRAAPTNLGQLSPDTPFPLKAIALDIAEIACSCFLGPVITPTTTVTVATTNIQTINAISTLTTTVPSSTTTTTEVSLSTVSTTLSTTTIQTVTSTQTISITAVASTTATTTAATPTSTVVVSIDAVFQLVLGPGNPGSRCVYNHYYDYPNVPNDPGPNGDYKTGVDFCQNLCAQNPSCKFFFFLRFDPTLARGYDGAGCILDDSLYDSSYLQCGYVDQYYVAYNRIS